MTIAIGDRLPEAKFKVPGAEGPAEMTTADLCAGKKVVLFGLPGAFTPTCHRNHLPGYLENLDALKAKGVDDVAVVSVNDVFVMGAWADATGGAGRIRYLADGSADFTKAAGLDLDMTAAGMGVRSKRYSMIVEDGVVTALNIEESPGQAVTSGAATILDQL